ncbi:hypothetical protein MTR_5g010980 [Medicago truncatula]|uniref:Uncharacterized protein n=1 Tax=Medicago truncatula TaxID=3880 RepID=G7KER4_MEDTR|nr:hypothetical protein MTR_5g010980 [Medicago truncatula]
MINDVWFNDLMICYIEREIFKSFDDVDIIRTFRAMRPLFYIGELQMQTLERHGDKLDQGTSDGGALSTYILRLTC